MMKLNRVHVQNYRSIVDSNEVEIEENVTVLIGKNEQGKTNFLKALTSFNVEKTYSPSDFPNHLRPSLEEKKPKEIPVITLWFSIGSEDRKNLDGIVEGIRDCVEIKCTKYYGNNYVYWIIKEDRQESELDFTRPETSAEGIEIKEIANSLSKKLVSHGERIAEFGTNKEQVGQIFENLTNTDFGGVAELGDSIKTFSTALKGLPSQDETIQEDVSNATKEIDKRYSVLLARSITDPVNVFRQSLPTFIIHSTKLDQIPDEVNIGQFVANPEGISKGMLNLCRTAGLTIQKIKELAATSDTSEREAYEDHYRGIISGGLNEYWTQQQYIVHFRIENDRLHVSISDNTYESRISPSDRSDGFQWYLSFYSSLLNEIDATKIILLDNPGLELHLDGQKDIKQFLEEKIAFDSTVIYVTHSPAMIDPFNLSQLRKVELLGNQAGTKVTNSLSKEGNDFDLLEPVRAAIGMSLAASLVVNDYNLLVEGAADKPILEGAFHILHTDESKNISVNGSISESKDAILPRFFARTRLPLVVYLDADSNGRRIKEELEKNDIPDTQIVMLDAVITRGGKDDFELEDIISDDFYYQAVLDAYPDKKVDKPQITGKKQTKVYDEAFKAKYDIGFNKKRVGESLKSLLTQNKADEKTLENLRKLTDEIMKKWKSQTSQ